MEEENLIKNLSNPQNKFISVTMPIWILLFPFLVLFGMFVLFGMIAVLYTIIADAIGVV